MSTTCKKNEAIIGSLLKQNNTEYSELPANLSPRDKIKHEIDAYLKEQNLDAEGNAMTGGDVRLFCLHLGQLE